MSRFIDREACVNCGACQPQCPVDAISEDNGARKIDEATCIDCGACEAVCPASAISSR